MIVWDRASAAHLLRRAGFGASRSEVAHAVRRGQAKSVERLLRFRPSSARFRGSDQWKAQRWWISRMLHAEAPLQEKLVLFWHGHFATAIAKVEDVRMMDAQNRLFREMGAGKFRDLLVAVSKDPAMIVWLDGIYNTKEEPNENFAREVMELFTLGVVDEAGNPNYTQSDVVDAARAFTGYSFEGDEFVFYPEDHDDGVKTVLGLTGPLTGDDVANHLAGSNRCARFLARKLWSFFAYPDPEDAVVDALAQVYLAADTEIVPVLRAMFLRDEFYSARAKTERVSPPAEFVVATLRTLGARTNPRYLPQTLAAMGQDLLNPPNVAGWPGGLEWLTSQRLLERHGFAWRVAGARDDREIAVSTRAILDGLAQSATPQEIVDHVLETFGPVKVPDEVRATLVAYLAEGYEGAVVVPDLHDPDFVDGKVRGLVGLVLTLPEANLV